MSKTRDGNELQPGWQAPGLDATLEHYVDDRHGFLRLTVTATQVLGGYITVPRPQESWSSGPSGVVDEFTVDLQVPKPTP